MKTLTRSNIYVLAAMILAAALTVAATQKQVPFKGSLQAQEIDTPEGGPPPTTTSVDGNPTGIATHVVNSRSPINLPSLCRTAPQQGLLA